MTSDTPHGADKCCLTTTAQYFPSPPKGSLNFHAQPSVDPQALKEADWARLTWVIDSSEGGRVPHPADSAPSYWMLWQKLASIRKIWPFIRPISAFYSSLCSPFLSSCKSSYKAAPWRDWRAKCTTLGVFDGLNVSNGVNWCFCVNIPLNKRCKFSVQIVMTEGKIWPTNGGMSILKSSNCNCWWFAYDCCSFPAENTWSNTDRY